MKKQLTFIFSLFALLLVGVFPQNIFSQQKPPPIYETDEEAPPPDLAIEQPKKNISPKQTATPKPTTVSPPPPTAATPTTPSTATQTPEPQITPPLEEKQTVPSEPATLPPPSAPTMATPQPAESPKPATATQEPVAQTPPPELPSNVRVISVDATTAASLNDLGPNHDAGDFLENALPITFHRYEQNFLSPEDLQDTFKFFTRTNEGIGVILTPKNMQSQIAIELLGVAGEVLTQTQAEQPGAALSFQTSPFTQNGLLYLRVRDLQLSTTTTDKTPREYAIEIRPIVQTPSPIATQEIASPKTPQEQQSIKPQQTDPKGEQKQKTAKQTNGASLWDSYGSIAIGILVVFLLFIWLWIRKKRRCKKEEE